MRDDRLARLRACCLVLPGATEQPFFGTIPTFRVGKKIFALYEQDHHGSGRVGVWCKAPAGMQEALTAADPGRFYAPPYVGGRGWIGIRLEDDVDWDEVAARVEESFRMTAPKRLVAELDDRSASGAAALLVPEE